MDAVKYLKEKRRMCGEVGVCRDCPLNELKATDGMSCYEAINNNPEEAVSIVEQWSKEHPVITNRNKLKEVFGEIFTEKGELIFTDPNWWDAEYKEPKGEE